MHEEEEDRNEADESPGMRNLGQERMEGLSGRRGKRGTRAATDSENQPKD